MMFHLFQPLLRKYKNILTFMARKAFGLTSNIKKTEVCIYPTPLQDATQGQ